MKEVLYIIVTSVALAAVNAALTFFDINILHNLLGALVLLCFLGILMHFMPSKRDTGVRLGKVKVYKIESLLSGGISSFLFCIVFLSPALVLGEMNIEHNEQQRLSEELEKSVLNTNSRYADIAYQNPLKRQSINRYDSETTLIFKNTSKKDISLIKLDCSYTLKHDSKTISHQESKLLEVNIVPGMSDLYKFDVQWPENYEGKKIDLDQWRTTAEKCKINRVVVNDKNQYLDKLKVKTSPENKALIVTNNSSKPVDKLTFYCLDFKNSDTPSESDYRFNRFVPDPGFSEPVELLLPREERQLYYQHENAYAVNQSCWITEVAIPNE